MVKDPNEFARGILDTIIAKHDPESVKGKDAKKVSSGLKGGSKGGHARAKDLHSQEAFADSEKGRQGSLEYVKQPKFLTI